MMSSLTVAPYFPFARMKVVGQNVHVHLEKPGTLVYLEPDWRFHPLCHACGQAGQVHSQGLRRVVRDLDMGPTQTFLQVAYRRVWCPGCRKAGVEQLSFTDPSRRITHRLARYVYRLCQVMTVEDVARHLDLNPKTVKAVDKHFLEQESGQTDYDG